MNVHNYEQIVASSLKKRENHYKSLSDSIWGFSETKFIEYKSAELLMKTLKEEGFHIEQGVAGLETAFIASYGTGEPVIGFLGEYDALEGLSQKENLYQEIPEEEKGNGHGCGHHLLGVASLAAAVAAKDYLVASGKAGRVKYYGCPGEENGGGKVYMVQQGCFNGLDAAITWHPGYANTVLKSGFLANVKATFEFIGKASHAALTPELGRSALDGLELMNIGINFLREHVPDETRLHYAILDAGGDMPNVVQGKAKGFYIVRGSKFEDVEDIYKRVEDIGRGAALMTGTNVKSKVVMAYTDFIANEKLSEIMSYHSQSVFNDTEYTSEEMEYAIGYKATFQDELKQIQRLLGLPDSIMKAPILQPMIMPPKKVASSTDVGNVSYVAPTVQLYANCYALGTPNHSWQMVAQGKSTIAHKGMINAGEIMARTACDCFENPELVEAIRIEHNNNVMTMPELFNVELADLKGKDCEDNE